MNEKIRELMVNSGFATGYDRTQTGRWILSDKELEKFAELIVRECIGVVEGGSFLHDQAPTAIFARECSGAIKRHFGVE